MEHSVYLVWLFGQWSVFTVFYVWIKIWTSLSPIYCSGFGTCNVNVVVFRTVQSFNAIPNNKLLKMVGTTTNKILWKHHFETKDSHIKKCVQHINLKKKYMNQNEGYFSALSFNAAILTVCIIIYSIYYLLNKETTHLWEWSYKCRGKNLF